MLPRTTTTVPRLESALEDLTILGIALLRNFHTGAFPACTRLARNVRAVLTPRAPSAALPYTIVRADAMLTQIASLQAAVTGLAGVDQLHEHRLARAADALASYRQSLAPAAAMDHPSARAA